MNFTDNVVRALKDCRLPGLSDIILLLANMAFGFFLQDLETSTLGWAIAVFYIVVECSVLSVAFARARDFVLLGFKSDVGYTLMALAAASFAVVIVAWVQISTYFLTMLAAAVLLRIKLYIRRSQSLFAFFVLVITSFVGLGLSWLPVLITGFD